MMLDTEHVVDSRYDALRSKTAELTTSLSVVRESRNFRAEYKKLSDRRGFENFQLAVLGLFTVSDVYIDLYRQNVFVEGNLFDALSVVSLVALALCYYLLAVEIFIGTYVAIKNFVEKKEPDLQGESGLRTFLLEITKMAADTLMLIASVPALRILRPLRTLFIFTHLERITHRNSVKLFVGDTNSSRPIVSIAEKSDYTRVGSKRFLFLLAYSCSLVLISVADSIFQAEAVPLFHGMWPLVSDPLKPDSIKSFADALWYSVNDLTTVGCQYNVYTLSGRVLAVLLIVLGFTLLALLTNFFMRFLLSVFSDQVKILSTTEELAEKSDQNPKVNHPETLPPTKDQGAEDLSSADQE